MRNVKALLVSLSLFGCQPPPAVSPETGNATPPTQDEPVAATDDQSGEGQDAPPSDEPDTTNLPPAQEVLAHSLDAVGGKDKIDSIKSYYAESVVDIPAQSLTARTKMWWKEGLFYSETDMPALGLTRIWQTTDGLWADDPIHGMRQVEGKEARQTAWMNALVLQASWNEFFDTAQTTGRRKSGGKTLIDVKLSHAEGDEVTLSFDEQTWLLAEQSFMQESPVGPMPITMRVEAYEDFNGFKHVTKSMVDMKVAQMTNEIVKFEPNAAVDAKKLTPPKAKGKPKKAS